MMELTTQSLSSRTRSELVPSGHTKLIQLSNEVSFSGYELLEDGSRLENITEPLV
jgi:hypothetical protein